MVPNLQGRRSVGKKVQNSQHFLPTFGRNCDISPWFCCGIDTQTRTVTVFLSCRVTMQLVGGELSCQQVVLVLFSCCYIRKWAEVMLILDRGNSCMVYSTLS